MSCEDTGHMNSVSKRCAMFKTSSYHSLQDGRWSGPSPTPRPPLKLYLPLVPLTSGPLHFLFCQEPPAHTDTWWAPSLSLGLCSHHLTREAFRDLLKKWSPCSPSLLHDRWRTLDMLLLSLWPCFLPRSVTFSFGALVITCRCHRILLFSMTCHQNVSYMGIATFVWVLYSPTPASINILQMNPRLTYTTCSVINQWIKGR